MRFSADFGHGTLSMCMLRKVRKEEEEEDEGKKQNNKARLFHIPILDWIYYHHEII